MPDPSRAVAREPPAPLSREERTALLLARWLDDRFLDPILGLLLPGLGDLVSALVGAYIVVVAVRKRLGAGVVARMIVRLTVDAVAGAIPGIGDIADFLVRANRRNVELLLAAEPRESRAWEWLLLAAAVVVLLLALALPAALLLAAVAGLAGPPAWCSSTGAAAAALGAR